MLPEQQQRILGYFIEEARDHLNTIEQGLLNLQSTLNDPEMVNEVFRAAHSIKGSAAMLGLNSIQHTSHRLEDCFKVLKEHPVQVDQKLESLFLGVCDTLKVLLEHLSGPFGLSEEAANTLMSETEPVFEWLNEHLELLVQQSSNGVVTDSQTTKVGTSEHDNVITITDFFIREDISNLEAETESTSTNFPTSVESSEPESLSPISVSDYAEEFQAQVLQILREMLQLFKKQVTPESRHNLQQSCQHLVQLGQRWNLSHWCNLCQAAASAIANPENTYLTLAKIVITEIKQGQELVLQDREHEIQISQQLTALLNWSEVDVSQPQEWLVAETTSATATTTTEEELSSTNNNSSSQPTNNTISLSELSGEIQLSPDAVEDMENYDPEDPPTERLFWDDQDDIDISHSNSSHNGLEVGLAELTTLADLFAGETLDETWQENENLEISATSELGIDITNTEIEDVDSDLADFLYLDETKTNDDLTSSSLTQTEELNLLFRQNFAETEQLNQENQPKAAENVPELQQPSGATDSDDILAATSDENELLPTTAVTPPELTSTEQPTSNEELFLETNNGDIDEFLQDSYIETKPNIVTPDALTIDALFEEFDNIEKPLKSSDEQPDISDLFDISPSEVIEFTQKEENFNDFWNEETATQQQDSPEQDVVQALEESLFVAAASSNILRNITDSSEPDTNLDETLTSDNDDLFADFAAFDSQPLENEDATEAIAASTESEDLFGDAANFDFASLENEEEAELGAEISDLLLETEGLDLISDLTEELPTIAAEDSEPVFGDFESNLFDTLEENQEIVSELGNDSNNSTDLEVNDVNGFVENGELFGDTSLDIISGEDLDLEDVEQEQELDVDISEGLDLVDDLFSTETEQPIVNAAEMSLESLEEVTEASDLTSAEEILGETADLSYDLLNLEQISETTELIERENIDLLSSEAEVNSPNSVAKANRDYNNGILIQENFAELEALLADDPEVSSSADLMGEDDFADLEALLNTSEDEQEIAGERNVYHTAPLELSHNDTASNLISSSELELDMDDEFSDLEKLLAGADQSISHSSTSTAKLHSSRISRASDRRTARFEETMKVPVKQLDEMSNLVGELVVNRNTLEQDHERLRQSLDNLLIQVQHLSDVGARMQELYERSLLEASLLASRKTKAHQDPHNTHTHTGDSHHDRGFSELEMDRFTPFHTLSQEMIELIVRVRESASDIDFVTEENESVARQFRQVTSQLQEGLTRARMVPFSQTIDRLRRGVRDHAIKYGKQVELLISGGDTLIDKMILDHLTNPLTHMLNNAIAHGIETPEMRQKAGKPPTGYITISALYQGNQIVISVGDDGAGIDPERVKAKAVQMGMMTPEQAKSISRMQVYDLLFQPGFSIKDKADEISGRGVGMDVVRSEISEIRGTVSTDSSIGKGTTFTIRLPVTLSICKALCCVSDKARIAFPMDGVEDTLDIPVKSIHQHPDGQTYIYWRDQLLPFRPLKELLKINRQLSRGNVYGGSRDDDMVSVVVLRAGNTLIALQIDLVLSEQEIVIKQFEPPAPKPLGVAGATILGDGRIMPIADVLEIVDIFQGRISQSDPENVSEQPEIPQVPQVKEETIDPTVLIVDDSITVRELLSMTFQKAGYRVEQARDGQEAWDKLRSGLPCNIVFCDIEMPRCDGLELLSRIQKDSHLKNLPIAMLTSRGADKHRQMAIQLGASGYFTKPYLEEVLLEAAGRMLAGEKLVNA